MESVMHASTDKNNAKYMGTVSIETMLAPLGVSIPRI
jgi:hypothetical protein